MKDSSLPELPRAITSKKQHKATLKRISLLMDAPESDTWATAELDYLAKIVTHYEEKLCPVIKVTPVEAILFRMEQMGLQKKDLVPYLGSFPRVSEVLSGKRKLTLPMIRRLHYGLGIPLQALIGE